VTDVPVVHRDLLRVRPLACPSGVPLAVEVRGADDAPITLALWDIEGRQVAQTTVASGSAEAVRVELDCGVMPGGVYLVTARSHGRMAVTKVVLLR
jgi:hypothetical protein